MIVYDDAANRAVTKLNKQTNYESDAKYGIVIAASDFLLPCDI